ncbi:MAG: sugar phosphate isomerase/epimerase [Bryobacterales bacterium]|nr:sugar phosphate isomerase/epimerase [Bryobacterales bacterium]
MEPKLPLASITDEFSPDYPAALSAMESIGMRGAELRLLFGKNIIDLTDDEIGQARRMAEERSMAIVSLASPLLKCVLPGAPEIDIRFQQDMFNAKFNYEDQPRLAERAFELAKRSGAKIIRVFSFWRTVEPDKCLEAVINTLGELAEKAKKHDLTIGLENEHACNIATGVESAAMLKRLNHPNLKLVWDPANALVAGEAVPFPDGYRGIAAERIAHVHVKDCYMDGHKPLWGPVGTRGVQWKGQIAALLADGYKGYLSLETHWAGPNGDKMLASTICGWNMVGLASA